MKYVRNVLGSVGSALIVSVTLFSGNAAGQGANVQGKRDVTVADAIALTRLADPSYFSAGISEGKVAQFSPDGKQFVIALRKGILKENVNEYSIYLFRSDEVFHSPKPVLIAQMKTSSNRPGIGQLKWLADNRTITFLGEHPKEIAKVYSVDTRTRHIERLTRNTTPIISYDISRNGRQLVYLAERKHTESKGTGRQSAISITDQKLADMLAGKTDIDPDRLSLFTQRVGDSPHEILADRHLYRQSLSIAPDGRHAIVAYGLRSRELPKEWLSYTFKYDSAVRPYLHSVDVAVMTAFTTYLIIDLHKRTVVSLSEWPHIGYQPATWLNDGQSAFLRDINIPLSIPGSMSQADRLRRSYDIEMNVSTGQWKVMNEDTMALGSAKLPLNISLKEDTNSAPKIYAEKRVTGEQVLLMDLNPQLADIRIGKVEVISWKVNGIDVTGGLYLPPDYQAGKRYPLVIQTHGFSAERFSMDGENEWSSGFAARALAAQGILVLQTHSEKNAKDHDVWLSDRALGATAEESARTFEALVYESAIDYLDSRGMIDKDRVGISGFSRTVFFVAYALTHTTHKFRAAILTDGIDGGYLQYLVFQLPDSVQDNGGEKPFSESGLKQWLKVSPGFNLDKVHTPIRLVSLDSGIGVLQLWEWFSGLKLQGRPVDFVAIPDAVHLLEKPSDRKIAMDGVVDWFRFWLQGYEDPSVQGAEQYQRWRRLKAEQDAEDRMTN